MELREYIALRRKRLLISQSEIASAMGYTDTAVSKIESGASTPPISILPSLANILKLSLHDLLLMKEDPAPLKSPNPPYDWKTVSLNLRAIRLSQHLRQKEAAEKIGINKRTLVTYEKGDACPNLCVLYKILAFYPGDPENFFYGVLYPEIQSSPAFRKRGPSPFFTSLVALFLGGGIATAVLLPFALKASSGNNGPYGIVSSEGDSTLSSSSSSEEAIPYLQELVVIGPDGIAFDAATKPNSTLSIGVYTGTQYSEQMRKNTTFEFTLSEVSGLDVSLSPDSTLYPNQILRVGDVPLGTLFAIHVKASLKADPTKSKTGIPLTITVNDTGKLTD